MQTAEAIGPALAEARCNLKAEIVRTGYKTYTEFAQDVEIHRVYLSKVLNGHMHPSPALQRRIAKCLGLTMRELRELL